MELLKDIVNFLIISGVLAWLIRSIVKLYLDKDIEQFKASLLKELDVHKALHTERMIVIKEIYKKIYTTYDALALLIKPLQLAGEPPENEREKIFGENYNSFREYFGQNRIFFEEQLATQIDALSEKFYSIALDWKYSKGASSGTDRDVKKWGEAWKELKTEVPIIKNELEIKFRKIIGVN